MNNLKYENNYYEKTLEYMQKYSKIKEDGYYKIDLLAKVIKYKHSKTTR